MRNLTLFHWQQNFQLLAIVLYTESEIYLLSMHPLKSLA